jgi:hypothetical protein
MATEYYQTSLTVIAGFFYWILARPIKPAQENPAIFLGTQLVYLEQI